LGCLGRDDLFRAADYLCPDGSVTEVVRFPGWPIKGQQFEDFINSFPAGSDARFGCSDSPAKALNLPWITTDISR